MSLPSGRSQLVHDAVPPCVGVMFQGSSVTSSRQSPEQCSILLELLYGRVFSLKTE